MKRNEKDDGFSSPHRRRKDRRLSAHLWEAGRLLPPLPPDEYALLKASISRYGIRVPIVVDQAGMTIDGWHRDRACDELGIYCPREVRHFDSDAERLQVAISLNANRRHLNRQQRRKLIATFLRCDPRINDSHLGEIIGVSKNTVAVVRGELEATRQIDKLAKRSGRDGKERPATYRRIIANSPKELEKALGAIKNLRPSLTDRIMDATTAGRHARCHIKKEEIAAKVIIPLPDDAIRLYHCPFQQLEEVAGIVPASVPLICTDIPYGKEFLPELNDLAAFAERVLVDGGLFVTYSGHFYLDQVMQGFGVHLIYRWMVATTWNGNGNPVYPRNLVSNWKPILVYSKGNWRKRGQWYDLLQCDCKEKDWHPWQQPIDDIETLIRYFSEPGDLVVDPCGGGFTTAVACRNLARRCIACDVDRQCVQRGWERFQSTPCKMPVCKE